MSTVVLDTHVLHWWAVEPERLSPAADQALRASDELAVSAISWFELGWLIQTGRLRVRTTARAWISQLAREVRTIGLGPVVAATAAELPSTFPGDPVDRLIFATAMEHGLQLVTGDRRIREHDAGGHTVIW